MSAWAAGNDIVPCHRFGVMVLYRGYMAGALPVLDNVNRCAFVRANGRRCKQQHMDGAHWCEFHIRMGTVPLLRVRPEDIAATNPMEALLEEIARTRVWVRYFEMQCREHFIAAGSSEDELESLGLGGVNGLAATSWTFSEGDEGRNFTTRTHDSGRMPAVYQMLTTERQHLAQCTRFAIQSGLEAKQVEIAERQAEMLIIAMSAFARQLGADPASIEVRHALSAALAEARGLPEAGPVIDGKAYQTAVTAATG
jgi:hypothetical protein